MNENDLKKHIAQTGYSVGYSAKLHFATFEIINNTPKIVSFISTIAGALLLAFPSLSTTLFSFVLFSLGISGLFLSAREKEKADFENNGIILTGLFHKLKDLMIEAETNPSKQENLRRRLSNIQKDFNQSCLSGHVIFSKIFAHYKFFSEQEIEWIEKYRPFTLKDKLPLSFRIFLILVFFAIGCYFLINLNALEAIGALFNDK